MTCHGSHGSRFILSVYRDVAPLSGDFWGEWTVLRSKTLHKV